MIKKHVEKCNRPDYFIGTAAMLILMYICPHVLTPWAAGITPEGVAAVCIFFGAIVGILSTNDLIMCALFSMGAMVTCGIFKPGEVIAAYMGVTYVWQVIVLYALCYVIIRDHTGETIARFLLTRRFTQKYPFVMIVMLMLALGIASALMGVFGALMFGFAMLDGIYVEAKIDRKSLLARMLYIGAFITMCTGPMTIGSMQAINLTMDSLFVAAAGVNVVTYKFVLEAFALLVVFCVVYALCLKYLFRCDIGVFARVDLSADIGKEKVHLTRRQAIPLSAFVVIAIYSFTAGYWPDAPIIGQLKSLGTVVFTSLVLAILALIRVDGEQIFNPVEAFSKGVSWPIVMAIASLACIGGKVVADDYGVKAWLAQVLGGLFPSSNPVLFVLMTVFLTVLMTNFASNTATFMVMAALVSALCMPLVAAGYDITVIAVLISMSSQVAFLTYASSGQAAILMGHDNIDNKFIWTYGLAAIVIYVLTALVIGTVFLLV